MSVRPLVLALAVVLACATPLASARSLALPSGTVTIEAAGPGGAVYSYDDEGFTCTPPSGSTFPLGDTPVSCVDGTGSPAGSFTVSVVDTTPPVVTPPADVTVTTGDPSGTAVSYGAASATDAVAGSPPANCSPPSGSNFNVGTTVVTCTASDGANTGSATFNVTVNLVDTTAPTLSVPGPVTAEATSSGGASVPFSVTATDLVDPSPSVTCDHASGDNFALGTTAVTCTAKDASNNVSDPQTFNVTVADTTAPVVTPPADVNVTTGDLGGATVSYGGASASDAVAGSPAVNCAPASGAHFVVGTTVVTCSASDGVNTGTATFNVTVVFVDMTAPTVLVPGTITVEATGSGGAPVTFSVTATDLVDPSPSVSCDHSSGATFALGSTLVSCTATDAAGNSSAPATFTVNVRDTTAPVIPSQADVSAEATGPLGAPVSYPAVTAGDSVDGTVAATCVPASGSTFQLGDNTVTCNATDAHGNHAAPMSFTITVRDTTAPAVGAPGDRTVEANGPSGSAVNYALPTAVDLVDGPIAGVDCAPSSGSVFHLGTTTVTCHATDAHGNTGTGTAHVTVADTTPPNLTVPPPRSAYATTPTGLPKTDPAVFYFVTAASATDIADPHPSVTTNEPDFLPVGTSIIAFIARDASGNATSKEVEFTVLPKPPEGTPPLPIPPAPTPPPEVQKLAVKPLDHGALITWQMPAGAREAIVTRFTGGTRVTSGVRDGQIVYRGPGARFVDRGLQNGVEYRYVVVTVDAAGNQSAGVAIVVFPRRDLLRAPKEGARLRKAPRLVWTRDPRAAYYNLQLLRNGVKILSVWPTKPAFALHRTWKYQGRRYTLTAGTYEWYVWPGYGPRSEVNYGELLGGRSFTISR